MKSYFWNQENIEIQIKILKRKINWLLTLILIDGVAILILALIVSGLKR